MATKLLRVAKFALFSGVIVESLVLAFSMRPIQDDYFNLQSVQEMGVLGYLTDTWNSHGGNMVQFLLHCLMILPTTQGFTYWNFSLFFLLTEILVFLSVRRTILWLIPQIGGLATWVGLVGVVSFEGLFVPGLLGAYGFSLASLAHLWPVLAFLYALVALPQFKGSWVVALLLGLVAGNSNLGESAFACGALLTTFFAAKRISKFEKITNIRTGFDFASLSLGTFIGSLGIVAAPGFWNRASDQVGLPSSPVDFALRFIKSLASFSADALTHPLLWVLFLLGVLVSSRALVTRDSEFLFRLKVVGVGAFLIWSALIMGSTFAYPAWHQSMGMYLLLAPLAFGLGLETRNRIINKYLYVLLIFSVFVSGLVLVRVGVMGVHRSQVWDKNLSQNICLLKNNSSADLLGAEIQYPPFNLGVEDINTWKWMRDKYVGWVDNISYDKSCL